MYISRQAVKRGGSRPKQMVLTRRDVRILESIHAFDGLMSLKQIDDLVNTAGDDLSPTDLKAVEARLKELGL